MERAADRHSEPSRINSPWAGSAGIHDIQKIGFSRDLRKNGWKEASISTEIGSDDSLLLADQSTVPDPPSDPQRRVHL